MTMIPAKVIIANLRADKKKLEDILEAIKKAFIKQFGGRGVDVINNNEDFEAAESDPKYSYYFANAVRKILEDKE